MGMFAQIKNAANSILPKLFEDEDLRVQVTWRKFASSVFDSAVGYNVTTYVDTEEINAIRVFKAVEGMVSGKVPPGPQSMQIGDVMYLFQADDVPSGASPKDQIKEGDLEYAIDKIIPVFGIIVQVEVKGYA